MRSRFKGLDLIRVPDELWVEVRDIVQDRNEDHSQEKEMWKSKMAEWGGLTINCEKKGSEKQRRKGKIKLFECRVPKIARRDKKAILSDQCKETEGKNRMGKTRDLFKKIRDTKGTFHAEMVSVKERNGRDLTETEDIKKRWQEYTELYKKIFTAQIIVKECSLTDSQTSWNVKSSGPQKASLRRKLGEEMELQLNSFKS